MGKDPAEITLISSQIPFRQEEGHGPVPSTLEQSPDLRPGSGPLSCVKFAVTLSKVKLGPPHSRFHLGNGHSPTFLLFPRAR